MKKVLLIIPVLFLLSCLKEDQFPLVENITKGSKWGLEIGSSAEDVYAQLQTLGKEKEFHETAIVYRKPFSKPEEIQQQIHFYDGLILQSSDARVIFQFREGRVAVIEASAASSNQVSKWPADLSDELSIHEDDLIDEMYTKLLAIYQLPTFEGYQLILPNKPLISGFDPGMLDYNEWYFVFFENLNASRSGRSSVRLYFNKGRLSKIQHQYEEFDVVN